MSRRSDDLRDLLAAFLEDVAGVAFTDRGHLLESGPWRGLRSVWVTREAVTFWLDQGTHVEARAAALPSDLADIVRRIVVEVSASYADVTAIRDRAMPRSNESRLVQEFIQAAEHLGWCEYRNGFYDESARCDCGLVASRRLIRGATS